MRFRIPTVARVVALVGFVTCGAAGADDTAPLRTGWAEVQLYSIDPAIGLESYQRGSAGGAGLGGTFGAGVDLNGSTLTISVSPRQQNGKFLVDLKTEKKVGGEVTQPPELNREIDLTDMTPFACELGRDAKGQVHRLRIVPTVKTRSLPKQFRVADLNLTEFNLGRLPVILNEREFIGAAGVDGGEVISLGIAGLADIQFSLHPFPEAVPDGELYRGTLSLRHEQDQLQIHGVTNGERKETLDGGPYKVFVRWQPPQMSFEQYVGTLQEQLDGFRERAQEGDLHAKLLLPQLEAMTAVLTESIQTKARTACLYSSGARQLSNREKSARP